MVLSAMAERDRDCEAIVSGCNLVPEEEIFNLRCEEWWGGGVQKSGVEVRRDKKCFCYYAGGKEVISSLFFCSSMNVSSWQIK